MRWDSQLAGMLAGLLMPFAGFFIYGLIHTTLMRPHLDLTFFIHDLFLGTRPILSLSLIANLPLFFLFDKFNMYKAMRGVIMATLIYGAAIVVLWM